jgi:hypothetical protein
MGTLSEMQTLQPPDTSISNRFPLFRKAQGARCGRDTYGIDPLLISNISVCNVCTVCNPTLPRTSWQTLVQTADAPVITALLGTRSACGLSLAPLRLRRVRPFHEKRETAARAVPGASLAVAAFARRQLHHIHQQHQRPVWLVSNGCPIRAAGSAHKPLPAVPPRSPRILYQDAG